MPASLYLVGSGQAYSSLQAAFDAVVSDYAGTLTQNVEIRANAGETFTKAGSGSSVLLANGLTMGSFRLTVASASITNRAIIDAGSQQFSIHYGTAPVQRNITVRGFKMTDSLVSVSQTFRNPREGCIIELCESESNNPDINGASSTVASNPVIIRNNYIHGKASGVPNAGRAGFGIVLGPDGNVKILNNTIRRVHKGIQGASTPTPGIVIQNNIFYDVSDSTGDASHYWMDFIGGVHADMILSNNLYNFSENTAAVFRASSVDYATLALWQAFTGKDANSLTSDPLLTSLGDPHIAETSPARGAGVTLTDVTEDWDGATPKPPTPSIGADEPIGPLTSVTPKFGANTLTALMLTIKGNSFYGSPTVKLRAAGYPDITATGPIVVNAQTITAIVSLLSASTAVKRDVEVTI